MTNHDVRDGLISAFGFDQPIARRGTLSGHLSHFIDKCAHAPMMERPEGCDAIMDGFLRGG